MEKLIFKNYTPHDIVMNDGTIYPSLGIERVKDSFTKFDKNGICNVFYGDVEGLPQPEKNVMYIVSSMVKETNTYRKDLVAPATGHPDTVRDKGRIVSVPGFVHIASYNVNV